LTISLSLDVYLIAKIILKSMELGLLVAVFIPNPTINLPIQAADLSF
jgi:hypothetical protein